MAPRILLVDDEPIMLDMLRRILGRGNYEVLAAGNGQEALAVLRAHPADIILTDINMPYLDGMDLLSRVKTQWPQTEVIMMTAHATIESAVKAVKSGAYDYLTKPFENIDDVVKIVEKALERKRLLDRNRFLEQQLEVKERFEDIIGKSATMKRVFDMISSVSHSSTSVLIQGESGTGKELVARALHFRSPRKDRPFVVINCSALTETLLESELFGHAKGSFTGAIADKKGLFEAAHDGTLFLDEIGDIPPSTQVKLLRVLQEGEIKRVGSNQVRNVDVRTITATNVDLREATAAGRFREDLYYRLNVITIYLPSLRERKEDIPLLAHHFLKKYKARMNKDIHGLDADVVRALMDYDWPGNVRELENVIERATVLQHGDLISLHDLPPTLLQRRQAPKQEYTPDYFTLNYKEAKQRVVSDFEERYVTYLLSQTDQNISQAAKIAGLDRSNFRRIIRRMEHD